MATLIKSKNLTEKSAIQDELLTLDTIEKDRFFNVKVYGPCAYLECQWQAGHCRWVKGVDCYKVKNIPKSLCRILKFANFVKSYESSRYVVAFQCNHLSHWTLASVSNMNFDAHDTNGYQLFFIKSTLIQYRRHASYNMVFNNFINDTTVFHEKVFSNGNDNVSLSANGDFFLCKRNSSETKVECGHNHFSCGDGTCILLIHRCDTIDTCPDKSDETGCPTLYVTKTDHHSHHELSSVHLYLMKQCL